MNEIMGGGQTSVYDGGMSHRSGMGMTPGVVNMGFSPADGMQSPVNFYASPAAYQASPGYGSPNGSSPIYMIPNAGVAQSPGYVGASPIYQANANMAG